MHYEVLFLIILAFVYFYSIEFVKYREIKYLYDRTNEINNTLLKISEDLQNYEDINNLYKKMLCDTINLIKGADCGSILIYNKQKDEMEFVSAMPFDLNELKKIRLKREELYLYNTTNLKSPSIIRNPASFDSINMSEEKFHKLNSSRALDIKSTLSAPLYINGEFYGVINVDSQKSENAFSDKDIELIKYIARQLETALKNALLVNELIEINRIDKLTDVYNRRYFEEIMEKEIKRAARYNNIFSLIMIDMDNFKIINDSYGHNMGDEILRYFVDVIKQNIRSTDIVSRFAGDEFIIVMHNCDKEQALKKIEDIRNYFKNHTYCNICVEFSAGVCTYFKGATLQDIIISADNSMYEEKRQRKSFNSCVNL